MATPATANLTSLDPILKVLYPQKEITKYFYDDAPFLAMVPKGTDFGGKVAQVALRIATTSGRAGDFGTAVANKGAATYQKWLLTRARDFSVFSIDGETIDASRGDKNAIIEGLSNEVDAAMDALKRAMQIDVYRNGGGARGKGDGAYNVAGAVIQLKSPTDIVNFELNMWIALASTDGTSGTPRAGHLQVVALDRDLGTITVNANVNTIAGASNNDFIFQEGDFITGSTTMKITGLDGWIPLSAPTSTPFFGLDRSVDTYRLGGVRFANAVASGQIEETIQKLATRIAREGGKPDAAFLNPDDYLSLVLSLENRLQGSMTETTTSLGFKFNGIKIVTGKTTVTVYSDPNCPQGRVYVLQMNTWKFWTLGEAPQFLGRDGLRILRDPNTDSYTGRIGYYGQLYCTAPGYNGVALL